jgi:hypothetical protein
MGKGKRRTGRGATRRPRASRPHQPTPRRDDADIVGEMVTASSLRFANYIRSANSFEEAAAAARADLRQALDDVVRHARGQGLLRVVQGARITMVMERAMGGPEPGAALLELIALALASRGTPGTQPPERDPEYFPPAVKAAAQAALDAGALIPLFDAPPMDPFGQVVFQSIEREIILRNPVYPHMLIQTLRGLFDDPDVERDCREVLGFSGLEATNVLESESVRRAPRRTRCRRPGR